eukprot:gene2082-2779_t
MGVGSTSHLLEDHQVDVGLDQLGDIVGGAVGFADLQGVEGGNAEPHIACMDKAAASDQEVELSS